MRAHLERLIELEYLELRHGRLGSSFVYELMIDTGTPEEVAHIGLIDVADRAMPTTGGWRVLRWGWRGKRGGGGGWRNAPATLQTRPPRGKCRLGPGGWRAGGNAHLEPRACRCVVGVAPILHALQGRGGSFEGHADEVAAGRTSRGCPGPAAKLYPECPRRPGVVRRRLARNAPRAPLLGAHGRQHEAVLRIFMAWAAESDVTRAGEVTRPILEAYQRLLSRCEATRRQGGKRLGWGTQRHRLQSCGPFLGGLRAKT